MCKEDNGTIPHLFIHCRVAAAVWLIFLSLSGLSWPMPCSVSDLLESWPRKFGDRDLMEVWNMMPHCIVWTIWKKRIPTSSKMGNVLYLLLGRIVCVFFIVGLQALFVFLVLLLFLFLALAVSFVVGGLFSFLYI